MTLEKTIYTLHLQLYRITCMNCNWHLHLDSHTGISEHLFTCMYTQQVLLLQSTQSSPFMVLHSHSSYLQELSSSIREPKLPQHTDLDLVADSGTFPTVQSVGSLHLLRVAQLLQPLDHLFHNQEIGNWRGNREWGEENRVLFFNCETLSWIAMVRFIRRENSNIRLHFFFFLRSILPELFNLHMFHGASLSHMG